MKLFIPFLCYNHTANTEWMMSMIRLILTLKTNNISFTVLPITFESLVSRGRNAAVAHFLSDPDTTHILFIDSDIEFNVEDVIKLLQSGKQVVSAGYCHKCFVEDKMKKIFSMDVIPENPLELCTRIPIAYTPNGEQEGELVEADYVTTGFLLIHRSVFETMMQHYPEKKYVNDIDGYSGADARFFYDFFTVQIHPETRRYESEDYGFSHLWRKIGGKIWIMTNITLTHMGWYGFKANAYRHLTNII